MEEQDDFICFDFMGEEESGTIVQKDSPKKNTGRKLNDLASIDPLTPLPIPPWVDTKKIYSANFVTFLDEEIMEYYKYVQPTEAEHQMRLLTISRLNTVVLGIWENCTVNCFGSFSTKLYLPSSDLDCVVNGTINGKQISPLIHIKHLGNALSKSGITQKMDVIASSKVPIIKYVDSMTNFCVDVSFNMTGGLETVDIVNKFLADPIIGQATRVLMLCLKQFLVQRHLNEVFTGGIGSYALLCTITSFLKLHPKIQTGEIIPMRNIGILLIEYFELYGKSFVNEKVGIEIDANGTYYHPREYRDYRPPPFSIFDPQDENNDLTTGSYNYPKVKSSFRNAFMVLTSMIGAAYERRTMLSDPIKRRRFIRDSIEPGEDPNLYMITLLGSILTIDRNVLKQRDYVEAQYEKYVHGGLGESLLDHSYRPPVPERAEGKKRKRDDVYENIIYVDDSDVSSSSVDQPTKAKSKKNKKKKKDQVSSDDSDIVAYYGDRQKRMRSTSANLLETDGLHHVGKKVKGRK
ncbi:hypothetical protein BC833DRAFT_596525 [Globomyces pollinis-pini]|nr:hypothetical protein BC833DRAFT_596525 [Globomyces pollinis-pini]